MVHVHYARFCIRFDRVFTHSAGALEGSIPLLKFDTIYLEIAWIPLVEGSVPQECSPTHFRCQS